MTPRPAAGSRNGFALVLVLVVLLALTALFHGALVLARGRIAAARAGADHLRLRLAAESAARIVTRRLGADSVPGRMGGAPEASPGSRRIEIGLGPSARAAVEVRPLAAEWLWLEAAAFDRARADAAAPAPRVGRVLWVLDPRTRARALTGEDGPGATAAVRRTGRGPFRGLERVPSLGLLDGAELERRGGRIVEADRIVGPAGRAGGGCPPVSRELIAVRARPPGPDAPDPAPSVVRVREGALTLERVRWTGVVAVSDDLILGEGARLDGVALVGGRLEVRRGGCLRGAFRATGGLRTEPGAVLRTSRDLAESVLRRTPGLSRPLPPRPSSWVGLD